MESLVNCLLCGSSEISLADERASVWRCASCGYYFDNPRPTPVEIDRFYSRPIQYDEWLTGIAERDTLWKRRLRKVLQFAKPGTLLDVGAGIGQFLGRVEAIDFKKRKFDNITLFHVLEHVHDPQQTLARCWELLSPNGMLFIAVPNDISSLACRWRRFLYYTGLKRNRTSGILDIPKIVLDGSLTEIHLSHFTDKSLNLVLERNNFKIVERCLDQYYVANGIDEVKATKRFNRYHMFFRITGLNLYETMWIAAQKID